MNSNGVKHYEVKELTEGDLVIKVSDIDEPIVGEDELTHLINSGKITLYRVVGIKSTIVHNGINNTRVHVSGVVVFPLGNAGNEIYLSDVKFIKVKRGFNFA